MTRAEDPARATRSRASRRPVEVSQSSTALAPRTRGPHVSPRILLVDDEDGFRHVLGLLLTEGGYSVIEAHDGDEALVRYLEGDVDIVLTDIFMPRQDGVDLIRALRALDPAVRIVAYSAAVGDGRGSCGLDVPLLAKPADFKEIEATLKKALGS